MSYEANLWDLKKALSEVISKVSRETKSEEIGEIIEQARGLAFDFGLQRCRLQIFAPQVREEVLVQPGTYRDFNNDHEVASGVVELVVGPGLARTGDGRGHSFRETINIFPAGVYIL